MRTEPINPTEKRFPACLIVSWLLPAALYLATGVAVRWAQSPERRTGYFDGFGQGVFGLCLVLLSAAAFTIAAIRRRERGWPLAFIPLVASGAYIATVFVR